jgi:peptide/nickel transport system substrate-binding protein
MKAAWRWGALAAVLLLVFGVTSGLAQGQIKNPDTVIVATIGDLETLDPAWHYDTASATAIMNIYDSLIFYDREKIDQFVPALATKWTISPDGKTYTFTIRKGVKFHEGGDLSPEDVAYSLQRGLLQDRSGGPQWILLDPILGVSSIDELAKSVGDVKACEMVKEAISVQGDNVVIKLKIPFAPMLQILAGTWGSVLDKEWMIAQGDWDGKCDNWRKWHDPEAEKSTIFNKANGTGPYKLEKWTPNEEIRFVRNENYWRNTTAAAENERWGLAKMQRAVIKVVPEWGTRLAMFQAGDADIIAVPRAFVAQMDPLVQQGKARMYKDLPTNSTQDAFFNFKVEEKSPFVPLLGRDKKPDLLSDIHMRKAFNYCFDTDTYIKEAWLGEAKRRRGPIPSGLLGYNPEQPVYEFSLEKCEAELKAAWDGRAWNDGFQVTLTYNTGNVQRKIAAELLEKNLESFNAKRGRAPSINVNVLDMPWPSYLKALDDEQLAVFWIGWLEDYHHPHNWVQPFMHSRGAFAGFQQFEVIKDVEFKPTYATFLPAKKYANLQELFDDLIEKALLETDLKKAEKIYFDLQKLAIDWAIDIFQAELLGRHYEQPWLLGWFNNPAYPGEYFFWYWKGTAASTTALRGDGKDAGDIAVDQGKTVWLYNAGPGTVVAEIVVQATKHDNTAPNGPCPHSDADRLVRVLTPAQSAVDANNDGYVCIHGSVVKETQKLEPQKSLNRSLPENFIVIVTPDKPNTKIEWAINP